jgi:hypothetical protein
MFSRLLNVLGLSRGTQPAKPASEVLCFGRDKLSDEILRSTFSYGCVQLFGGRQSGKTTILRHLAHQLSLMNHTELISQIRLPVYVDLMRLPYDATPRDFFATLARLSVDACQEHFPKARVEKTYVSHVTGLESFETTINKVQSSVPCADVRFVFLLDESKRIIGDRYPRGFHDNLFHVLFGNSKIQGVCYIVFAGAQELYRLCEDDTSPIGSRAAKHCLTNLKHEAVGQIAQAMIGPSDRSRIKALTDEVYSWTGGHAGLSAGLLRALAAGTSCDAEGVHEVVMEFRKERSELFQLWVNSLTIEARVIHDVLLDKGRLTFTEVVEHLRRNSLAVHRCDRVSDELQYVGLARRDGEHLVTCNKVYSEIARLYVSPAATTALERSVWQLVEQTEIGLRKSVRVAFDNRWKQEADDHIRLALGDNAWARIIENRDKYAKNYPRSHQAFDSDEVLNFTYLGQLGQLVTWNKSWDLFRHLFRDKRELDDIIRDIVPVRNDSAHFRSVPELELNRCRVRCIDLLTILERNQELGVKTRPTFRS